MKLFLGSNTTTLGRQLCRLLAVPLGHVRRTQFKNGEQSICLSASLKDEDVVVFKAIGRKLHDDIFELLLMIDAAHRGLARKVIAVVPFYPYARQHQWVLGAATPAQLLSQLLKQAGATELVTVDLHAADQKSKFAIPTVNLSAAPLWLDLLQRENLHNAILFGADASMQKTVQSLAEKLRVPWGYAEKERAADGSVQITQLHGSIKHKNIFLMDDLIDTGATLYAAAQQLRNAGAASISALVTHTLTSRSRDNYPINTVLNAWLTTDTFPFKNLIAFPPKILSVAPLLVQYLKNQT